MTAFNEISASDALSLGNRALESESYSEAHAYFAHVLETEPGNVQALMGKGLAAGWQSNLRRSRLPEMLDMYRRVKSAVPAGSPVPQEMAAGMLEVLLAYDRLSREHTMEFISVDHARYESFDRAEEILLTLDEMRQDHADLAQEVINPMMVRILKAQITTSGCMGEQLARFKGMLQSLSKEASAGDQQAKEEESSAGAAFFVIAWLAATGYVLHWLIEPQSPLGWIGWFFATAFGGSALCILMIFVLANFKSKFQSKPGPSSKGL